MPALNEGLTANKRRPNGRLPDDEVVQTKEMIQSPKMDGLLLQFMNLTSDQLKAVFSKSISDWNTRGRTIQSEHYGEIESINEEKNKMVEQITEYENLIADAKKQIAALNTAQAGQEEEYYNKMNDHDKERALIENMQQLFKPKLDGFEG